jgi:PDZ domain-containing protein
MRRMHQSVYSAGANPTFTGRQRGRRAFPNRRALDKMQVSMRPRRQIALFAITLAAFVADMTCAWAQGGAPSHNPAAPSDQTLEIAPRIAPPPPPAAESPPATTSGATGDDAAASRDGTTSASQQAPPAKRPYLGIAVQTIYANDRPNGLVTGLEVVSVDRNSPAAVAGLRGRTKMTSIGETGATASSLIAPLDLFMMPLLKKTGSLGQGGDLIVAIDDRRVINDFDLQSELESRKPGDLIYLTITRAMTDGSRKTLKMPIKLGAARTATADADGDAVPLAPSSAPSSKNP